MSEEAGYSGGGLLGCHNPLLESSFCELSVIYSRDVKHMAHGLDLADRAVLFGPLDYQRNWGEYSSRESGVFRPQWT